jgi:hypothetical protein
MWLNLGWTFAVLGAEWDLVEITPTVGTEKKSRERNSMKRILFGPAVLLVAFSFLTVGRVASQEPASVQMETRPIRQGDMVRFIVDLDKAPNVDGAIFIKLAPNSNLTEEQVSNTGIRAGTKRAEVLAGIPLEAPIGTWKVTGVCRQNRI